MPCSASYKTEHPLSILSYRTYLALLGPPFTSSSLWAVSHPYRRAQYSYPIKIPVQDRREILSIEETHGICNTAINCALCSAVVCERGCFHFCKNKKSVSGSLCVWILDKSATEARILKKCRESEGPEGERDGGGGFCNSDVFCYFCPPSPPSHMIPFPQLP